MSNDDYLDSLRATGIQVQHVLPIGYIKALTRIALAKVQDIDVLFMAP